MEMQKVLALVLPLLIPLLMYLYNLGFYESVFFLACAISALTIFISKKNQLIIFLVAFSLALIGDPLNVLLGTWGYSENGFYVHGTEMILVALGWGLVSWASFTASKWINQNKSLQIAIIMFLLASIPGFFLSNVFPLFNAVWILFLLIILYKIYKISSKREKSLMPIAFSLGLIVEFFGVFLGIWWYSNPAYRSILQVLSISLAYSLLIWGFSRITISLSKSRL